MSERATVKKFATAKDGISGERISAMFSKLPFRSGTVGDSTRLRSITRPTPAPTYPPTFASVLGERVKSTFKKRSKIQNQNETKSEI